MYLMNIQQTISRFSLCLLVWCVLAAVPAFAQTITHVPLFTFDGDSDLDEFGASVSGAGDVNGDGFADFIVGAPNDDNNGLESGSARVFSGVDGSVLYDFDGESADDLFGGSVSGAGDVNGDGFADLIVGVVTDDNNGEDSGSARVFSGVDGSVLYTFDGDSASDQFGFSVSGAGDVNGDGFADFAVGAPNDDNNGLESGSARVFSGVDGSVLYTFDGDSADDLFGVAVSGAGDVNGDGFADLIVGVVTDGSFGFGPGSARVFSGVDGSVLYNFDGDSILDGFGLSVSGAGDVNGDGFADLIVGAANDGNNGFSSGSARVLSGVDGSVLYNFDGDSALDQFGSAVSGAGDVNGDGFADLIVGAPDFIFLPPADGNGTARVLSGVDGSVLYNFEGDSAFDSFGTSVSGAGDINGDGVADFIVGAKEGGYARVFVSQITGTEPSVTGDFDLDGDVDLDDLDRYIGNTGEPASGDLEILDLNGDGTVGANDFEQHYETLVETSNGSKGTFAGDANLDGTVNVLGDAFTLVGNLGSSVSSWADGDFNGDGTVNVLGDAFLLVTNLGQTNDPAR